MFMIHAATRTDADVHDPAAMSGIDDDPLNPRMRDSEGFWDTPQKDTIQTGSY